jgi:hypothetical protein
MTTPRPVSGWWYLLGAGLLVLGPAVTVLIGVSRVQSRVEAMPRALMPGTLLADLEPGEYALYREENSIVEGRSVTSTPAFGLSCGVQAEAGGRMVPIVTSSTSTSYTVGSYSGRTIGSFEVVEAGGYRIDCELALPSGMPVGGFEPRVVLAVGSGVTGAILTLVGAAFASALVGLIALLVVRSKRKKWKRAQEQQPPAAAPPPSPPLVVPPGT